MVFQAFEAACETVRLHAVCFVGRNIGLETESAFRTGIRRSYFCGFAAFVKSDLNVRNFRTDLVCAPNSVGAVFRSISVAGIGIIVRSCIRSIGVGVRSIRVGIRSVGVGVVIRYSCIRSVCVGIVVWFWFFRVSIIGRF